MQLSSPQSYKDAAPELKALICNGAGPRRFGWLVPDTVYGLSIAEAANIHDWMYWEGKTKEDKEEADFQFLSNMLVIIEDQGTKVPIIGWILKVLRRYRASAYYGAVRDFGDSAFSDKGVTWKREDA
jgi:hypothetical protein